MASPTTDRRLGLVGNTAYKTPATVLSTANIVQSGEQTIDGIAVKAINSSGVPDRVLCTGMTDATKNGLWDVKTSAWTRSVDANGNYDFAQGTQVLIGRGSAAFQIWTLTTANPITFGTTALTWSQSLSAGSIAMIFVTLLTAAGASLIGFIQAGAGAILRTLQDELRDRISTAQFGVTADGAADDTAKVQDAINCASAVNGLLVISRGVLRVGNLTFPSNIRVRFEGRLHVTTACTLDWRCPISNPPTDWLFSFDDTPTNDAGSAVPVQMTGDWDAGPVRNVNSKVSVRWFGAKGDWNKNTATGTDDTAAINAAATALAFSGSGGFNANSKAGASTLYSPRGLYKLAGTVRVSSGCIIEGEYGGSTGLSNWYRRDGNANSMVILQSYGIGGVGATFGSQHIVRNMGFQFITTLAPGNLTQQNIATIEFRDAVSNIDTIFENCWLLDSPMSGAHFLVGNKNIAGVVTGLTVVLRLTNTNMDVNRGAHFKVQGNGVLNVFMAGGVMYQSTYGAVKSTSASSTQSRFDFHDVDVLLQGKVTDNDAGGVVNVIGGNVAQIYTDCRITGGSADGFNYGGGFTPAGGYLLVQGSDIYATGCRLLAGAAGSTTEVRFKGVKLDYSSITGALTSGPNKLMHLQNAATFEFSDCSVKSGSGTGFLYAEPGFGDVAKLFVVNNRTDLAAGTMDVAQTTSQIVISGNIYAATANTKTLP